MKPKAVPVKLPPTAPLAIRFTAGMVDWMIVAIPAHFISQILTSQKYQQLMAAKPALTMGNPLAWEQAILPYVSSLAVIMLVHTFLFLILCLLFMIGLSIHGETGPYQATPGKRLLGLEVHSFPPYNMVTASQSFTRVMIGGLSWIFFNIGHATALFRKDKLMAHDLASQSRVVQTPIDPTRQKWTIRAIQVGFFLIFLAWLLTRDYNALFPI